MWRSPITKQLYILATEPAKTPGLGQEPSTLLAHTVSQLPDHEAPLAWHWSSRYHKSSLASQALHLKILHSLLRLTSVSQALLQTPLYQYLTARQKTRRLQTLLTAYRILSASLIALQLTLSVYNRSKKIDPKELYHSLKKNIMWLSLAASFDALIKNYMNTHFEQTTHAWVRFMQALEMYEKREKLLDFNRIPSVQEKLTVKPDIIEPKMIRNASSDSFMLRGRSEPNEQEMSSRSSSPYQKERQLDARYSTTLQFAHQNTLMPRWYSSQERLLSYENKQKLK